MNVVIRGKVFADGSSLRIADNIRSGQRYGLFSSVEDSVMPHRSASSGCRPTLPGRVSSKSSSLDSMNISNHILLRSQDLERPSKWRRPDWRNSQFSDSAGFGENTKDLRGLYSSIVKEFTVIRRQAENIASMFSGPMGP